MDKNIIILEGNTGKDPIKVVGKNKPFAIFSMATNEEYTDAAGQTKKFTEWHDVFCYGIHADNALKFLKKGQRVTVVGKIRSIKKEDGTFQKICIAESLGWNTAHPSITQNSEPIPESPEANLPASGDYEQLPF